MNTEIISNMKGNGQREFVYDSISDRSFTYEDILNKSSAIANYLYSKGIGKGSRVGIILNNSVEFITIYFANLFLGAITVPINPNYISSDYEYIINKCKPDIILTTNSIIDVLKSTSILDKFTVIEIYESHFDTISSSEISFEIPEIDWEDTISILFTSGTTGRPKGVVMKYGAVFENLKQYGTDMQFGTKTRFMQIVPLFHAHGWLYSSIVPVMFNSSIVLNQPFNVSLCARFWDIVSKYKANVLVCVPSILTSLMEMSQRYDTLPKDTLDTVICGSAFLHPELKRNFESTFSTTIQEFYGSTETIYIAYHSPATTFKEGTVGKLFPKNCTVRIADDGEILVKTKYLFKEYLDEEELTNEVLEDGWYKSGDMGLVDENGFVSLTGRKKDIINKGGYKVAPKEINDCLMRHPLVSNAATIGVPDQMYGEEIYSFVVVKDRQNFNEEDVLVHCRKELNPIICPKRIIIIDDIPKNDVGKIDKFKLVDIFKQSKIS